MVECWLHVENQSTCGTQQWLSSRTNTRLVIRGHHTESHVCDYPAGVQESRRWEGLFSCNLVFASRVQDKNRDGYFSRFGQHLMIMSTCTVSLMVQSIVTSSRSFSSSSCGIMASCMFPMTCTALSLAARASQKAFSSSRVCHSFRFPAELECMSNAFQHRQNRHPPNELSALATDESQTNCGILPAP